MEKTPEQQERDFEIIDEAKQFLNLCNEAMRGNRAEAVNDLKFVSGEQWPAELQNSRQLEARPCLTINKLDAYCRQICNQQRQQRPRIKVHPTNKFATKKIADVITGLTRHIEVNSNADTAYDTAFESAVKMGWGYWRIITKYISEDSFDQDIYIEPIENPMTVYFDPNSVSPDGSDANAVLITDTMSKKEFARKYPDCDDGSNFTARGTGDSNAEWVTREDIRVAEYFKKKYIPATLCLLSDGAVAYKDDLPENYETIFQRAGVEIVDERDSWKVIIKWCKLTALEVIEEKEWPSKYIPIIPVYGNIDVIEGKRKIYGIVRHAKDPQRMINYWETAATESIALAPKAKWTIVEGQDEGHENEWARANISAFPVLRYKQTDINGQPAPPPARLQPEPPPAGILEALMTSTQNLREVIGVVDPAQRVQGNVSGKALNAEKLQSDNSTFHFYDNLTRSIAHTGKIILDLIPKIYDSERVMRIIGEDGRPDMITINQRSTTAEDEVLNDVTIGQYDVVMDTGPGYQSKRLEAVDAMLGIAQAEPQILQMAGDLIFRNMDFPGAEIIADRLAAANPLAQIDDKSDIPPQAQAMIKGLQQQLQQAQAQLGQAGQLIKSRADLEQMKQSEETKRALINAHVKAHDTETWAAENIRQTMMENQTKHRDMELKALSAQHVEEIKGIVALLLAEKEQQIRELEARSDEEHDETKKEFRQQ